MKTGQSKRYNRGYIITFTTQFPLYFSKKEEEDGVEIPHDLIKNKVIDMIISGNYDISEESMI